MHTPIHTHFSYSEKSGKNLGQQIFDDAISSTSKFTPGIIHGGSLTFFIQLGLGDNTVT